MPTPEQIESNIQFWQAKADRLKSDLKHAKQQLRLWTASKAKVTS